MKNLTPLAEDLERARRVQEALSDSIFSALICSLPKHVLMLTGYWPVVGTSIAVVAKDGLTYLIVPQDEEQLAREGHADRILTFQPGSLEKLTTAAEEARIPLREVLDEIHLPEGAIGSDIGSHVEPASYAAIHFYGSGVQQWVRELAPDCHLHDAETLLAKLRSSITPLEMERVQLACALTGDAFVAGLSALHSGITERRAADAFHSAFNTSSSSFEHGERIESFFYCMSGANSALAGGAYARSRERILKPNDLIMIHCNSCIDGFWTDITRTYVAGSADRNQKAIYAAVFEAREAALSIIKPGVPAPEVDRAARDVLTRHGFGSEFTHQAGHGVGFDAISATSRPRIHPRSPDVLEAGMVFNIEPAVYIKGTGGIRHCDVVVVTQGGVEVLTPFQSRLEDLILPESGLSAA
jgi:Xaa-Pro aminopeptidase